MRQTVLFTKTRKNAPKDEVSVNAQLLIRAGFIDKVSAGVYTYLPLGLSVLRNIQQIVREEMDALGAQEILMPALTPKELWTQTGRWDAIDVLFKIHGRDDKEYALGWSHEEVATPLVQKFVKSYKDLPVAVYQIQDKFRDEPRAKSGLLRGREFSMKDMYSFHANEEDVESFYARAQEAYLRVYTRCGLDALVAEASGGVFSKYSHEFQVPTPNGEDEIYFCASCGRHQNKEIVQKDETSCPHCGAPREVKKTIEVGNIFKLKTRFTDAFDFVYTDRDGGEKPVVMGCYGIGPSRVMGAIAEAHHDDAGLIWPESVAPFRVHLVSLAKDEDAARADEIYRALAEKTDVLYDDRPDASAGEKFADSDLIGIPKRMIVSAKTLKQGSVEIKDRLTGDVQMVKIEEL
ncbi:MAG: hypothetical protein A3C90_03970 [Candidatus Magasanikbacteria bacterium RIFCSPHIGHO2_02_FULL_51_14]|uniref:Proline--tRNA ligase n=1 Tax=Candidatus Magasanikbacteria bacterium RIFCSPHIGHO2_02_FULL_51_14 TaxID=1798683 RepID=A0A1F6MNY1_9BACT|nr:MAG: hypothetical protein A3C90_03970 [Candidatus Magasanikbacteria bacterium RIFCSPHIGHO2_02_FULL_51_14]